MMLAGTGIVVGVVGAAALGRVLDTLLYDVRASDPLTLIGGSLVFLVVALGASLIPARRAARTPPAVALRAD
jgi:ABC-type lipoprotein release transport system permease subunit